MSYLFQLSHCSETKTEEVAWDGVEPAELADGGVPGDGTGATCLLTTLRTYRAT